MSKRSKIYMTGGQTGDYNTALSAAWVFNIVTNRWGKLPNMLQARFRHSSVALDNRLFVMGGVISNHAYAGSIEFLVRSSVADGWQTVVEHNDLIKRSFTGVAAISASKMVIFGGQNQGRFFNDGYTFDWSNKEVEPFLGKETDIAFYTETQKCWSG